MNKLTVSCYVLRSICAVGMMAFAATAVRAEDTADYLSFTARGGCVTISMDRYFQSAQTMDPLVFETSFDKSSWTEFVSGETSVKVEDGRKIYFRKHGEAVDSLYENMESIDPYKLWHFVFTGENDTVMVEAGGSVMSLLDAECRKTSVGYACFVFLFADCGSLVTAPKLPAMELATGCYEGMFTGCNSLTVAPELPAMELAEYCYEEMFSGCISLTDVPNLPAMELAHGCYMDMFANCISLMVAPELPATKLAPKCYSRMFRGCSSLKTLTVAFPEWKSDTTERWVDGVASDGWFVCPEELDCSTKDASHVPSGWTVIKRGCFVEIPSVEHLTANVSTNGVTVEPFSAGGCSYYLLRKGAAVKVSFGVDDDQEYVLFGDDTVEIAAISQDVVFGTTEGYPLPQVVGKAVVPVRFTAGNGIVSIGFRIKGEREYIAFPEEGTNLNVGIRLELQVTPIEGWRYAGQTAFMTPPGGLDETLVGAEILWGDPERPWFAGDTVMAWTNGVGGLVIGGSGAMSNFTGQASVPWAAVVDEVTEVTVEDGVTQIGANVWAGMADTVKINGTALSAVRFLAPGISSSAPPVEPSGAIGGAEPETVRIVDGKVLLGVSVCTNGDLTATTEGWEKAKVEKAEVVDGEAILTIPATTEQGFYILKSKSAEK